MSDTFSTHDAHLKRGIYTVICVCAAVNGQHMWMDRGGGGGQFIEEEREIPQKCNSVFILLLFIHSFMCQSETKETIL